MKVLNVGSLNIDHVYRVATIARPGETVASREYSCFPGGKGANQSVALARSGATVWHAGASGPEGAWLGEQLAHEGVDTRHIRTLDEPGGHALIQVDDSGQNSIVIYGGANLRIGSDHVRDILNDAERNDVLLLQNEINATPELIVAAGSAGLRVVFNPAPMTAAVAAFALDAVDMLIVNQHEAQALSGLPDSPAHALLEALSTRFPATDICLTLGAEGAVLKRAGAEPTRAQAPPVKAVDTTAAGDTFIGYLLAALIQGKHDEEALRRACHAAALSVTKPGAISSIPRAHDVNAWTPQPPAPDY